MTFSAPPTLLAASHRSPVSLLPRKFLLGLFLPLVTVAMAFAQSATQNTSPQSSEEMKAIFLADQFDRGNNPYAKPGDPQPPSLPDAQIRKNDDARDLQVQAMIREGLLHTGIDFFRAALVFQHSGKAEGTLLAHLLAVTALSKGEPSALWLSAATLDRYLIQTGKPQVFGTQFKSLPRPDATKPYQFVQDTIDPVLLTDPLRAEFCVIGLTEQQKGLPGPPEGTSLRPCPAHDKMLSRDDVTKKQVKTNTEP